MDDAIVDEAVWTEARRRAAILARTLPDAPVSQRLSISEAARAQRRSQHGVSVARPLREERRLSALLPRPPVGLRGSPTWADVAICYKKPTAKLHLIRESLI